MEELMQQLKRMVHFPTKLARQGAPCSLQSSPCRQQPVSTAPAVMQLPAPRWLKPAAASPSPDPQHTSSGPALGALCPCRVQLTPPAHLCWVGTSASFLPLPGLNSCNETTFPHGRHHLLETLQDKCFIWKCQNWLNCHLIFTTVTRKACVVQHISQAAEKKRIFQPWLLLKTRECGFLESSSCWSSEALDFIQALVVSSTALLSAVFPSWTVVLEHYPLLHQILLLTPLKQDSTLCYEEVLSLWQKALQYLQGITWNNLGMCNVFWTCVRALSHCLDGNFLELLNIRQTHWGCSKIWFHAGLQRKSNGQAPAGSALGRFKPTGTMNRISVCLHSQLSESSQDPQRKGNLTHKELFTTGVLEASPSRATGRESFHKELYRISG